MINTKIGYMRSALSLFPPASFLASHKAKVCSMTCTTCTTATTSGWTVANQATLQNKAMVMITVLAAAQSCTLSAPPASRHPNVVPPPLLPGSTRKGCAHTSVGEERQEIQGERKGKRKRMIVRNVLVWYGEEGYDVTREAPTQSHCTCSRSNRTDIAAPVCFRLVSQRQMDCMGQRWMRRGSEWAAGISIRKGHDIDALPPLSYTQGLSFVAKSSRRGKEANERVRELQQDLNYCGFICEGNRPIQSTRSALHYKNSGRIDIHAVCDIEREVVGKILAVGGDAQRSDPLFSTIGYCVEGGGRELGLFEVGEEDGPDTKGIIGGRRRQRERSASIGGRRDREARRNEILGAEEVVLRKAYDRDQDGTEDGVTPSLVFSSVFAPELEGFAIPHLAFISSSEKVAPFSLL
ncbi:hypothetical protein BDN71DRAFT_1498645 [Pleurotus eryngii]|uniref:Uncharacterized protein n=1 Tax=Pleurotus eryngii TaxID=5323 RepID=A0A9P5ZMW0_PLEER|nr:hypothetical protein BDN71DRAFT_1498645 [Pleurotus eryngii]